jgi:ABC-type uncharacterized transport system permease subunit
LLARGLVADAASLRFKSRGALMVTFAHAFALLPNAFRVSTDPKS